MNLQNLTRSLEKQVSLPVSAQMTWEALTEPERLRRWFAPQVSVCPEAGGSMLLSWGGGWGRTSKIVAWIPKEHLRLVQDDVVPAASSCQFGQESSDQQLAPTCGEALPKVDPEPSRQIPTVELTTDFWIRSGSLQSGDNTLPSSENTTLIVRQAGFPCDTDGLEEYRLATRGWDILLCALRHSLLVHPDVDRLIVQQGIAVPLPPKEAWKTLLGNHGLGFRGAGKQTASPAPQGNDNQPAHTPPMVMRPRYSMHVAGLLPISGYVCHLGPPWDAVVTVQEWGDALLHMAVSAGDGDTATGEGSIVGVALSLYGDMRQKAEDIHSLLGHALLRTFGMA